MATHIVLGGSLSSGRATPLSDTDYFVVSDDHPRSYFNALLGSGRRRLDIEFMERSIFEAELDALARFEVLIDGKSPTVSHTHLRFLCRMVLGQAISADNWIALQLREHVYALRRATAVAVSTHYFNLLEDVVGWALAGRAEDVLVNASDLFQRACLVMAAHRGVTDPNVKWGWRNAQEVACAWEVAFLDRFFDLIGITSRVLADPRAVADYCDAIVGLGYISVDTAPNVLFVERGSTSLVYLRGIPGLRVGYDFANGRPRVLTSQSIGARIARAEQLINEIRHG